MSDWNRDYYGRAISSHDIVLNSAVNNPNADGLRKALEIVRVPGTAQPAASQPAPAPTPSGVQPETLGRSPEAGPVTQQPLPAGR